MADTVPAPETPAQGERKAKRVRKDKQERQGIKGILLNILALILDGLFG